METTRPANATTPRDAAISDRHPRALLLILALALIARVVFALAQDPMQPYVSSGGDSGFYLQTGSALITGSTPNGEPPNLSDITPPPLYLIMLGVAQAITGDVGATVTVIRLLQALLSTATCYLAYRLARRLTARDDPGLIVAFVLAVSPVFIIEAAQIMTETLFIFLLTGAAWLYVDYVSPDQGSPTRRPATRLIGAAVLLGLATLTRAVLLLFPLGLAIHLFLVYGWRAGLRKAALLLLVYALVVSTWTIYNLLRWDRFVIAGNGFSASVYLGTTGWDGYAEVDERLAEQSQTGSYTDAAAAVISEDPLNWIKRRVGELAAAYLQPHGTVYFSGESLRELLVAALNGDQSLTAVLQGDNFLPKLVLYLFHYAGLIGGLAGMWLYRRRWQVALAMIGLIAYFTLVHLALYALPRYLFPMELFWWVFAAAAIYRVFQRETVREAS